MGSHSNVSILSFHLPKVSESLVLGLCVNRTPPPRLPPHPEMWPGNDTAKEAGKLLCCGHPSAVGSAENSCLWSRWLSGFLMVLWPFTQGQKLLWWIVVGARQACSAIHELLALAIPSLLAISVSRQTFHIPNLSPAYLESFWAPDSLTFGFCQTSPNNS